MIIPLRANYIVNDPLCPRVLVEEDKSTKDIVSILHKFKFIQTKSKKEELVQRILEVKDLFSNPLKFDSHIDIIVGDKDYLEQVLFNDLYFLANHQGVYRAGFKKRILNDQISLDKFGLSEGAYSVRHLRDKLNINRILTR